MTKEKQQKDDIETMKILFNADINELCNQRRFNDAREMEGIRDRLIKALEQPRWIPKTATNGDMIISLYPNLKYYVKGDRMMTTIGVASSFDLEWWNAPYRKGGAE